MKKMLYCHLLKSGSMSAVSKMSLNSDIDAISTVVGNKDNFMGSATLRKSGNIISTIPLESSHIGERSLIGEAADAAERQLQRCWGKVGPSI